MQRLGLRELFVRTSSIASALVLLVTSFLMQQQPAFAADHRALTMKSAERAIDLAWQAELAGDYRGAREELGRLVQTSTLSDEAAARQLVGTWLKTIDAREGAFTSYGKSARAYREAYETLREWGLKRSTDLWDRALKDVPELGSVHTSSSAVVLRLDLVKGQVDRGTVTRQVGDFLGRHEIRVVDNPVARAAYEVRLIIDASEAQTNARSSRVAANASIVVRTIPPPKRKSRVVGSVAKGRAESRRTVNEATSFAVRRVLDESAASVVYILRAAALDEIVSRNAGKG